MKFVLRYPVYAVVALSTLCATLPITPIASAAAADEAGGKKTGPVQRLIKSKKFQKLLKNVKNQTSIDNINKLIKKAFGDDPMSTAQSSKTSSAASKKTAPREISPTAS